MNKQQSYTTERFQNYFRDVADGASLVAKIAPLLTLKILIGYILQAVTPLVALLILKKCLDLLLVSTNIDTYQVGIYFTLFIATNILGILISQYVSYQQSIHQHIVSEYFAKKVLNKAIHFDLERYENPKFYNELHLVHQQTIYKPAMFLSVYQGIIQSIITILLLSGLLLTVHWLFPVLLLLISIPLAINKLLQGYHQYIQDKSNIPLQRKANDLYSYLTTEPYAKEVRVFNYGSEFIGRFLKLRDIVFEQKRKLTLKFIKRTILIQVLEAIIIAGAYYFLINSTVTGLITIGGLVIYIQMFHRFQTAINNLFQSGIGLFQHHLYLRNVLHYMKRPDTKVDNTSTEPTPDTWRTLELKALSFSYPGTKREVLHDINLNISAGQVTAIVGANGSGKSTLVKIISRLYDTEKGTLLLNGKDAINYNKTDWWKQSSIHLQDYGKYYMSVADNITLTQKEHVDEDKLHRTASIADIQSMITKMSDGFHTQLGRNYRNGTQLSGGQWQKLAVARSLYKKSNLLILDEPTSSLDPISEYNLITELKKDIDNKMLILVTHKLYNLKMVDKIVVMSNGEITEQGSFDELIEQKGIFYESYQKQQA